VGHVAGHLCWSAVDVGVVFFGKAKVHGRFEQNELSNSASLADVQGFAKYDHAGTRDSTSRPRFFDKLARLSAAAIAA
jgi:hypothetical protein